MPKNLSDLSSIDLVAPEALTYLPPALKSKLSKLGVHHLRDLLQYFPMRYEDQTQARGIDALVAGESVIVEGVVQHAEVQLRPRRQLVVSLRGVDASMFSPRLTLRYFTFYPSIQQMLKEGNTVSVFGEVRDGRFGLEMVHPIFKKSVPTPTSETAQAVPAVLTPVYPSTQGVPQNTLRTLIAKARKVADWQVDYLPEGLRAKHMLTPWAEVMTALHSPGTEELIAALEDRSHPAWRRVKFDELLAQQLALLDVKSLRGKEDAPSLKGDQRLTAEFMRRLTFKLTDAQARALKEVLEDMQKPAPMSRLLQGDVGSGKTVVAALAALASVEAGYQVAFMAPTELLAEQHFNKLRHWLKDLPVKLTWLAGSLGAADMRAAHAACKNGEAQIVVGTHALFQKKVTFAKLGLVVVDEQHRFGVAQRLELRSRGQSAEANVPMLMPHQLMMSATPIPRSLAMSYYADLDVSVIDELPGGRQPIVTKLVADNRREEMAARIYASVQTGAQAYWVCPLIEESEKMEFELQNATDLYAQLTALMPSVKVALLHGRMKPEEKAATMAAFAANEIGVLVATTVIEVGVDVPNANWMVIEHAERFGLAQLHQLRGRVGRGSVASTCIMLFSDKLSFTAKQRLKVIYETRDGFIIAREDLRIRGPGELLGPRQSGLPTLRYANIENDIDLVELVRDAAPALMRDKTFDKTAFIARWVRQDATWAKA